MTKNRVVSRQEWMAERRALLEEEKAFTRQRDALSERRRALPWVRVDETYTFAGPDGDKSLPELFGTCSQLLVYHFMYGPDWEQGCPSCSFWADGFERAAVHLAHRDMQLVVVSNAPVDALQAYRARMGWTFEWVSSMGSSFNFDYQVTATPEQVAEGEMLYNYASAPPRSGEHPGASAFIKDEEGAVFHTYSCYARGLDMLNGAYHWMDIAPKGRDEAELSWPMAWLRRRDQYED